MVVPRMPSGRRVMIGPDLLADVLVDALLHERGQRVDGAAERPRAAGTVPDEAHAVHAQQRRAAVLHLHLANAFALAGRDTEALAHGDVAFQLDPAAGPEAEAAPGAILRRRGDRPEIAEEVEAAIKAGATTIEFTPTKTGPIQIVCGMNMGKGQFTVAEPGTK